MDSISTHNNPPAQAAESSRQPIPYDNSSGAGNPGKRNAEKPSIKKIIGDIIRYLVPLAISIGLIVWMFHKVDFQKVMKIIHDGCDFFWIGAMMLITTVSHMIRGTRWGLQLRDRKSVV